MAEVSGLRVQGSGSGSRFRDATMINTRRVTP